MRQCFFAQRLGATNRGAPAGRSWIAGWHLANARPGKVVTFNRQALTVLLRRTLHDGPAKARLYQGPMCALGAESPILSLVVFVQTQEPAHMD
jgi:hypothetical protein